MPVCQEVGGCPVSCRRLGHCATLAGTDTTTPGQLERLVTSLSKHKVDGIVKLGRGPYVISTAILSMYADFQDPGTKYMIAPGLRKSTFLCDFLVVLQNGQFEKLATILTRP